MPCVKAASIIINRKRHELEQVKKNDKDRKRFQNNEFISFSIKSNCGSS